MTLYQAVSVSVSSISIARARTSSRMWVTRVCFSTVFEFASLKIERLFAAVSVVNIACLYSSMRRDLARYFVEQFPADFLPGKH